MPRRPDMLHSAGANNTLGFVGDGYLSISKRCDRFTIDAFATPLLKQPAVCMHGAEAARPFCDTRRLRRYGMMPIRAQTALFGIGRVQSLDWIARLPRKERFPVPMTPPQLAAVHGLT